MKFVVAGATGFLGGAFSDVLTQQGHEVVRLVRRTARRHDEARWDPGAGDIDDDLLADADVAERTRTNKIGPDELSGGTFTITNLGSVGALWDTPIINQPQVAILGPGSVVKRPVVIDDPNLGETIAVRHMVYLALTYDHQLVDGADAGRFLREVKQRLEAGQFEV